MYSCCVDVHLWYFHNTILQWRLLIAVFINFPHVKVGYPSIISVVVECPFYTSITMPLEISLVITSNFQHNPKCSFHVKPLSTFCHVPFSPLGSRVSLNVPLMVYFGRGNENITGILQCISTNLKWWNFFTFLDLHFNT